MPVIESVTGLKVATAEYDFAVDGGGTGTKVLRSLSTDAVGAEVPIGSVVLGGYVDVTSACLSGSGTMALHVEGAGDLLAASLQAALTAGRKSVVPAFTGASAIKTTAARPLTLVIATAAFTAGKFRLVVMYV